MKSTGFAIGSRFKPAESGRSAGGASVPTSPAAGAVDLKPLAEGSTASSNSPRPCRTANVTPAARARRSTWPLAAPGLQACTDAQFGKGTSNPVACPAGSKIGTASIETPVLPAGSLTGKVFLGQQLSRDPASGNEYRIFIDAESARYGLSVGWWATSAPTPRPAG